MAQIIVSPREQRMFAQQLGELLADVKARENRLSRSLEELGSTWADERYRRFVRAHSEASLQFQAFFRMGERYMEFLRRKAAAAERYLRT